MQYRLADHSGAIAIAGIGVILPGQTVAVDPNLQPEWCASRAALADGRLSPVVELQPATGNAEDAVAAPGSAPAALEDTEGVTVAAEPSKPARARVARRARGAQ